MAASPRPGLLALLVVVGGLGFGALVSAVDHGHGPAAASVSKVIGSGWGWLAAGLAACLLGRGWRSSWTCGLAFLGPAVLAYYGSDLAAGVYTAAPLADPAAPTRVDLPGALRDALGYLVVATLTATALATLVVVVRRGGVLGLLASLAVPGAIAYDALTTHRELRALPAALQDPRASAVDAGVGLTALVVSLVVLVVQLPPLLRGRRAPPG